jgi:hypothetical protein
VKVEFSELARTSIAKIFDEDRRRTCYAHLSYYLREKHDLHSWECDAFPDLQLRIYPFGMRRVLYEIRPESILVWSFLPAALDAE